MPDVPLLNPVVLNGVIEKMLRPETLVGLSSVMGAGRVVPNPDPTVSYDIIQGSRELAKPNVPNAEAHIVKQLGVGHVTASMIYLREKKVFSPTTMRWLRLPGTLAAKNAEASILREIQDLDNRFNKFAEFCIWKAFTTGLLQFSAGGVVIDLNYQFSATHKPTANPLWTDETASIITDVRSWKRLISRDAQAVPTTAYLNEVSMGYFGKNAEIEQLLTEEKKDELLNTGTIKGLLGLNWVVYDLAYVDDNGQIVQYVPDTTVVILSEDNGDRWYFYEGPSADDSAPDGHIGKFVKTWKEEDPSARQYLEEWHFLPAIWRPDQIIAATIA